jgi:hypothetical protein
MLNRRLDIQKRANALNQRTDALLVAVQIGKGTTPKTWFIVEGDKNGPWHVSIVDVSKKWPSRRDSNPQPLDSKSSALSG